MAQPITYKDLIDINSRLALHGAVKAQTAANRASTLRAFLALNKLAQGDPVGNEMRAGFPDCVRLFAENLTSLGKTSRSITNSIATLKPWRKLVVESDTERAVSGDDLPPFSQAFRSALKDIPVRPLAKQLAIPHAMLYGWLKGKRPHLTNLSYIHRVEGYLGITHGELAALAGLASGGYIAQTNGHPSAVPYREQLAEKSAGQHYFKPGASSVLRLQWIEFMRYKTDWQPILLARSDKAVWRTAPFLYHRETAATWYLFLDGVEVPSAKMAWASTASYLGWLNLSKDKGGAGVPEEDLHSLAWLAVTPHISSYVKWLQKRSGGSFNGGAFEFFSFVKAVLRADSGYLSQQTEFLKSLPAEYQVQDWAQMCAKTFTLVHGLSTRYRKSCKKSRDPRDPISHVLDLDNPMEQVADMLQRMRADRPLGGSPWREAIWCRDLVLIKILVSNPLRLRNLATLTWREDGTGQLYQKADGSWWIRIERASFKNTRGAAGDQIYDMPVQEMAWNDIERYLKTFRPRLLSSPTDYVFLAGQSRTVKVGSVWTNLSGRVETLTGKYLWRCPGVGTQ